MTCHDLPALTTTSRTGYWHFEQAHREVLHRSWNCTRCHNELAPFRAGAHKIDRIAQIDTCVGCHVAPQPN